MTAQRETTPEKPTINPMAMSVEDAARILSAVSSERITEKMIRADVEAGAPVTADGRINLVHYTAWLVREVAGGD